MPAYKFISHSYKMVLDVAIQHGWLPGARYTDLRPAKMFDQLGFLDIDWKNYDYKKHLDAVKFTKPFMTVAQDLVNIHDINRVLDEAEELNQYSEKVIIVPKAPELEEMIEEIIPKNFVLGYSVPTKYGSTPISTSCFKRPVHLLGGRPDVQIKLANEMQIFSLDCNRFTLDAAFGDYFDGEIFRPHPVGGYQQCITDSVKNINSLWNSYYKNINSNENYSQCQRKIQ